MTFFNKLKSNHEKTALVLSGGGSRGSYQIGVLKALNKISIKIDTVVGTSAGALNGAMIAMNKPDIAEDLWLSTRSEEIFNLNTDMPEMIETLKKKLHIDSELLGNLSLPPDQFVGYARDIINNGGVTVDGMDRLIKKYIDEEKIRKSPMEYGLVTVEYPSMTGYKLMKEDIKEGLLCDYIKASASCFPFMQYSEILGKHYIDGGFTDNLPISMALNREAKKIIAVDLGAIGKVHDKDIKLAKKTTDFYHIKSSFDLGNFLNFDPIQAKENMDYGYLDTLKVFEKLDGLLYFFRKGSILIQDIEKADAAAEIFQCPRKEIYTEKSLIERLKMPVLDSQVALRKNSISNISIQNISNILNKPAIAVYIAENILEKGNESHFYHSPLSEIFSKEILAAEFIISRNLLND